MEDFVTEEVSENYRPAPGQMDTRTFWIAYRPHIAGYGHMGDRISHAAGVGGTEEEALMDTMTKHSGQQ